MTLKRYAFPNEVTLELDDQGVNLNPKGGVFLRSSVPFVALGMCHCTSYTHHLNAGLVGREKVRVRAVQGHSGTLTVRRTGATRAYGPLLLAPANQEG